MEELKFMIPCLMGLEKIVADELKRLNMREVRASNGHVTCVGGMADIPRLNLWLRCGARVLLVLADFRRPHLRGTVSGCEGHRLGGLDRPGRRIPREGLLHLLPAPQRPRLPVHREEGGAASVCRSSTAWRWLPETGCRTQIQFSILKDHVTVALDTSGEGLYKRGYRAVGVEAPLRETLAAALVHPVPLPGAGPLPRPLLRQRHHRHRGRSHRQKPGPRPEPYLRRAEVAT